MLQEACQRIVTADQEVFTKVVPLADAHKIHGLRAVFGEVLPPETMSCVSLAHSTWRKERWAA